MSATIAICTDSSAQLGAAEAEALGVAVVPVGIAFDGEPFADETDLDVDAFYARLAAGTAVSTSLPSPGRFEDAYVAVAAAGAQEVVSIHLDARVSGTVAAARLAARTAPVPVTVLDAGTVSYGVALAVVAAARAVATGLPASRVPALVGRVVSRLRNVFVSAAGQRLLAFEAGAARVVGECESGCSTAQAIARVILAGGPPGTVAVGHAHRGSEPAADEVATRLERAGAVGVRRYRVGPSVGAHAGPFSFGAFWSREPIPGVTASDPCTDLQSSPRRVA